MYFTKKPSTIEAIPWLGSNAEEVRKFCVDEEGDSVLTWTRISLIKDDYCIFINDRPCKLGEWIVKEKGQFYVCDAEEFLRDYEPTNG